MAHLHLENIGPIQVVDIDLTRVNIFIGPQSSGKSTIAKMISFCLWIEKKVATTLTEKIFSSAGDFVTTAEMYHKMHNYFNDSTVVRYESDVISINYAKDTLTIKLLDKFIYKRKKIVYMPSDRNLVAMPELEKLTLTNKTNLQSFTFDWLNARNTFDKSHKLNLLDLDMQYYYDGTEQIYKDKIVHSNGKTYDISLYDASSGLQSITPLVLMLHYYNNQYFNDFEKFISYEKQQELQQLADKIENIFPLPTHNEHLDSTTSKSYSQIIEHVGNDLLHMEIKNKRKKMYKQLTTPYTTDFIIEEPEQNLFPEAQEALLYWTLEEIKRGNDGNYLFITTHSPYILFALNNCLMGGLVKDKVSNQDFSSEKGWIDVKDVSIYEIHDGKLQSIQDNDGLLNNNYLNQANKKIANEYMQMLVHYD